MEYRDFLKKFIGLVGIFNGKNHFKIFEDPNDFKNTTRTCAIISVYKDFVVFKETQTRIMHDNSKKIEKVVFITIPISLLTLEIPKKVKNLEG